MARVHPAIGIQFTRLAQQIQESLLRDRLMAMLAGAFGILAGMLATLGLYGVIAYMVARRRNEIGVRVALGANRGRVVRLVLREAALLLAVGLAVGTGLALWAGRAAGALLFGLKPYDPHNLRFRRDPAGGRGIAGELHSGAAGIAHGAHVGFAGRLGC